MPTCTRTWCDHANVVAGYQTYPHVDMHGTGLRAGDALVRLIKGQAKPTTAWGNVPMLPHVMRQGSADEPNKSLQARAQAMEAEGALCASLFVGFPHADIANAGLSVVVTTDNDLALAERYRDELLQAAWEQREAFVYKLEKLEDSVARAKAMPASGKGPVILLDHYDNAASGGPMDTTRGAGRDPRARNSTMSPPSASSIPRRCARPRPPASAPRSRCPSAAS